jgi:CPA2 family monovalent cation:H+ antiporter-2/glutathione-regulated potassium-efflux system protein KefB
MAGALIATKALVIFAIGRVFGMQWRQALALGLLLSQGGEFGFVLLTQAQNGFLIAPEAASLFGAIITLSMASTPFLMMATRRFREAPIDRQGERDGPRADGANALVVGYGRFGQTVAQMLIASGVPVTLIDRDIEMIDIAAEFGAKVYFGDGTRLDLLRQAGASEAELILFCVDGDQFDAEWLESVHEAFPHASVYVRAFDRRALIKLKNGAARYVVREVLESAIKMARAAMQGLHISNEEIDRAEDMYRVRDRERLRLQIEAGDIRAARERIITQSERDAPISPGTGATT